MARRINIVLDDNAWLALQEIPRGERSKLVSKAIKEKVEAMRRHDAVRKMDELSREIPAVSTAKLVSWIRKDRNR